MFTKTQEKIREKVSEPVERIVVLLTIIAFGIYTLAVILMVRGGK